MSIHSAIFRALVSIVLLKSQPEMYSNSLSPVQYTLLQLLWCFGYQPQFILFHRKEPANGGKVKCPKHLREREETHHTVYPGRMFKVYCP